MDSTPDRFDIDLGAHEHDDRAPQRTPVAEPERDEAKTLTEMLASAAADRAGAPLA